MSEYKHHRITDQSYNDIRTLYWKTFSLDVSEEEIRKKYDTQAFGLKNTGVIAMAQNGEPAAYYGVFPTCLTYQGKDYLVAQSADTMTAPEHQKKGLFVKLAQETYQLSRDLGVRMVFGFPNQNSYPGFKKKLNWVFQGHMQKFTLKVKTLPLCELASQFKAIRPLYEKFVRKAISKFVLPADSVDYALFNHSNVEGKIRKDEHFFRYKLRGKNVYLIKISRFTLLVKAETHLFVGAVGKISQQDTGELLQAIRKLSTRLGCSKAVISLSENHWLFNYLKEYVQPEQSLPVGFYLYDDAFDISRIQFEHADYDTF